VFTAWWVACGARSAIDVPVDLVTPDGPRATADAAPPLDASLGRDALAGDDATGGHDAPAPESGTRDAGIDSADSAADAADAGGPDGDASGVVDATSPPDADACVRGCPPVLPPPPRAVAPLSTANVSSHAPVLRWLLAPGTDGARVDLCSDRTCAVPVTSFLATGSRGAPPTPLARGVYFWRLAGTAGGVVGSETSPVWEFFVGARDAPVDTSWGSALDVDGDGFADVAVAVRDQMLVYLGGAGSLPKTPLTIVTPPPVVNANATGGIVAAAGDVNGDGFGDILVSGGAGAYLYLGGPAFPTTAPIPLQDPSHGVFDGSHYASSLASAGDVNGDGYADLVIGDPSPAYPGGTVPKPAVYLYYGGPDGPATPPSLLVDTSAGFAQAVAGVGDVDGDGYADLAVDGDSRMFLYLGGPAGPGTALHFTTTLAQTSLAGGADVNGDGYADIVVGEPSATGPGTMGAVDVRLGGPAGPSLTTLTLLPPTGLQDLLGISIASAGDTNGDGFDDLIVGATLGPMALGAAFVYLGNAGGVGATPVVLDAVGGSDFGYAVGGGGDFDGDGLADLVVVTRIDSLAFYRGHAAAPETTPATSNYLYWILGAAL
jgi:hypothetical protein